MLSSVLRSKKAAEVNVLIMRAFVEMRRFLANNSLMSIPPDIDFAYYLVHSMSATKKFEALEKQSAINFREALNKTQVKQVVYLSGIVDIKPLSYMESIKRAFKRIEQNAIVSSWKDSTVSGRLDYKISEYIQVLQYGCFKDVRKKRIKDIVSLKLPGEAWLEFRVQDQDLIQTATFRPKGLLGRMYWMAVFPFHSIIFSGPIRKLTRYP